MGNIEKYYNNTEDAMLNYNVKWFIELNTKVGNVIELGCGRGRETLYLIKNGWNISAIDREDVGQRIAKRLNNEEIEKFKFCKQDFEIILIREIEKDGLTGLGKIKYWPTFNLIARKNR